MCAYNFLGILPDLHDRNFHRDTNIRLQKKIQDRGVLREQRIKVEKQQSEARENFPSPISQPSTPPCNEGREEKPIIVNGGSPAAAKSMTVNTQNVMNIPSSNTITLTNNTIAVPSSNMVSTNNNTITLFAPNSG